MTRDVGAEIAEALATVHLDRPSSVGALFPTVRNYLDADNLVLYCPIEDVSGWSLERFEHDNFANPSTFERRCLDFFATAPRNYGWFDAMRPEPAQRNRVLDALDIMSEADFVGSRIYREVFSPLRLGERRQPRVLICPWS